MLRIWILACMHDPGELVVQEATSTRSGKPAGTGFEPKNSPVKCLVAPPLRDIPLDPHLLERFLRQK